MTMDRHWQIETKPEQIYEVVRVQSDGYDPRTSETFTKETHVSAHSSEIAALRAALPSGTIVRPLKVKS